MPIEHDGQVFINGHQLTERLTLNQFLGAPFTQNVRQGPIRILDVDNQLTALYPGLVLVLEPLSSQVAVNHMIILLDFVQIDDFVIETYIKSQSSFN